MAGRSTQNVHAGRVEADSGFEDLVMLFLPILALRRVKSVDIQRFVVTIFVNQ
jgi:hypothetical protein